MVAFLAITFVVNNSSYAQTYIPLPNNNLINEAGDYNLDSLMIPAGTAPAPPTTIQVDISKVNYFTDVHIGTNITNPTWGVLPTGYQMPNGYSIYSSYVRPLIPGPYDVVGDQGYIMSRIQFIATPQIQFLSGNGTIVKDWSYIVKGQTINAPIGATQAEVRLPEWFTYTGSNLGSNVLVLNTSTLIGGGNQSLYTLTQSGNYECRMSDGYPPNPTDTTSFPLVFPVGQSTITTSSNPANGGTVSGGGTYTNGTSCTVQATANSGYQFTNWTEHSVFNGAAVSTSANYTFTVSGNRTLVANFAIKEYTLTVNNGTGSGNYAAGAGVPITANTAPEGKQFKNWTTSNGGTFADAGAPATTFTMPGNAVTVTANYEDIPPTTYALTVQDGTGGGNYEANAQVSITANAAPSGKVFDKWTGGNGGTFADANATSTTFTMPANAATVTATYKDAPPTTYTLTVNNGTGGGSYAEGMQVPIVANAAPDGKTFDRWTSSNGGTFANANEATTTFTMPGNEVTVTANYEDIQREHKYLEYSITNNVVQVWIVGATPDETYSLTVVIKELGKENISVQVTNKGSRQWEFPVNNTNNMYHLRAQYNTIILEAWIKK